MQLEQTLEMYRPTQMQMRRPAEQRQRNYTIVDLESLSAGALYMPGEIENGAMNWVGNVPTIGGSSGSIFDRLDRGVESHYKSKTCEELLRDLGLSPLGESKPSMGLSRPLKYEPKPGYEPLTSIRLPESRVELHIHERPGGIAHIKYKDGTYTEMNSYDAAIADLSTDKFDFKKFLGSCRLKLPESD